MVASLKDTDSTTSVVGSTNSSGLSATLVAELSALVFVKLVKMLLSEEGTGPGIHVDMKEQLLADDVLEAWAMELDEEDARLTDGSTGGAADLPGARPGSMSAMADMTDDEMVARALAGKGGSTVGGAAKSENGSGSGGGSSGGGAVVVVEAVSAVQEMDGDGEVWAAESDDDDVIYEGADPAEVAKAFKALDAPPAPSSAHGMPSAYSSGSSYRGGLGGVGGGSGRQAMGRSCDPAAVAASLRRRRAYVLKSFSSSMLLALPPNTWAKVDLVEDIRAIIRALRKQRFYDSQTTEVAPSAGSAPATPASARTGLETSAVTSAEGTKLSAGAQAASNVEEEAWVRYACALRDFLISRPLPAPQTESVLAVVLDLFDDDHDDESASTERDAAKELTAATSKMTLGSRSSSSGDGDAGFGPGPSMALLLCHSLATSLNANKLSSFTPSGGNGSSSSGTAASNKSTELPALVDSLRRGLCTRLPLLTQGLDASTEVLVAAFAAPAVNQANKETATATEAVAAFSLPELPSSSIELSGSAAVALEQARVLLGCAAFGSGVALAATNSARSRNSNSGSSTSSTSSSNSSGGGSERVLTACPFGAPAPAAVLLSSGCLRAVLKLLATLAAATPSPSSTAAPHFLPPPQVLEVARLARALLACWCAQGHSTVVDFVVRSPSTPKALSVLTPLTASAAAAAPVVMMSEPGAVLLAMVLSMGISSSSSSSGVTSPLPGGATGFAASAHGLAREAATALLPPSLQTSPSSDGSLAAINVSGSSSSTRSVEGGDLDGAVALVASLGALGPRVVVQVRAWAKKPVGAWVIPWLKVLQAHLLEAPKRNTAATATSAAGPVISVADTSPSNLEAAEAAPPPLPPSAVEVSSPSISEEALISGQAAANGGDDAEFEAAAPELAGEARGATRAAAARRAEAIRVLKQLLAVEAGGNKTD